MNIKNIKSKTIFLILMVFMSLCANSKQISFKKSQNYNDIEFKYKFLDASSFIREVKLSIPMDNLKESYNEIPKLSVLQNIIYNSIPKYAKNIISKDLEQLNTTINDKIQNIKEHSQYNMPKMFALNTKCPKDAFEFDIKIIQRGGYKIESKAQGCAFSLDSQSAYNNKELEYKQNTKDAKAMFNKYWQDYQSFNKKLSKTFQQKINRLNIAIKEYQKEVFSKYYLQIKEKNGRDIVYIDYKKLTDKYKNYMPSLKIQQVNMTNDINYILNFVQSIPYDTLQSRDIKGISGFLPPFALLDKNKGDCDSKSVIFLAFLKKIYPNLKTIIVIVPNHAFIGVAMRSNTQDTTLNHNGTTYVLAETAGPKISDMGEISDKSYKYIQNNQIESIIDINE